MHRVAIHDHDGVLWDIHPVVHEIARGVVRRAHPERTVQPLNLLDDGTDVWQGVLVLDARPVVTADDLVKLGVCSVLDLGMRRDERDEPLERASGLQRKW